MWIFLEENFESIYEIQLVNYAIEILSYDSNFVFISDNDKKEISFTIQFLEAVFYTVNSQVFYIENKLYLRKIDILTETQLLVDSISASLQSLKKNSTISTNMSSAGSILITIGKFTQLLQNLGKKKCEQTQVYLQLTQAFIESHWCKCKSSGAFLCHYS
jgi:hypothetical protein